MANSRHFPRPTGANLAVNRWSISGPLNPLDPVVHWTSALTLSCNIVMHSGTNCESSKAKKPKQAGL